MEGLTANTKCDVDNTGEIVPNVLVQEAPQTFHFLHWVEFSGQHFSCGMVKCHSKSYFWLAVGGPKVRNKIHALFRGNQATLPYHLCRLNPCQILQAFLQSICQAIAFPRYHNSWFCNI